MKKLVIFDLDGTLVNSLGDLSFCMNKMLKEYGLPEITKEETIRFIGYGAKKYVELSMKGKLKDKVDECLSVYSNYLATLSGKYSHVYDGLLELVYKLKEYGVKIAIVTNKPQDATEHVVNTFFKKNTFDEICGIKEGFLAKPDVTAVNYVINKFGFDKKDVLFVGDSEIDMMTAVNAKIDSVGVLWGFRTKEELTKAGGKTFVDNAKELYNIIKGDL